MRAMAAMAVVLWATAAEAAPNAASWREAQKLTAEAKALEGRGRTRQALEKYRRADKAMPRIAVKLAMGRLNEGLGDLLAAAAVLREAAEARPVDLGERRAQIEAKKLLDAVEARSASLSIELAAPEGAEVTVTIDEREVEPKEGLPLNPGTHVVAAQAEGYAPWRKTVTLPEGGEKTVHVALVREAPAGEPAEQADKDAPAGSVPRWSAWTMWGLTAASLGVGIGYGVTAIRATRDAQDAHGCADGRCPADAEDDLRAAKLQGNVSTAAFAVAGAAAVTASVLTYFAYRKPPAAEPAADHIEARPILTPGFIGLTGRF